MFINDEKKKVTIYSVAAEAGVSLATVSRVINDSSLVKEDTRKKVEAAIDKLDYRPNAVAQGLALKKTTTIALIIPDSSFVYIGKIINGLLDVAKIYKYNISLHTSSSSLNEMEEIVENVVKSRVDGVIIYNDSLSESENNILNSFQMPVIYIGNKALTDNSCGVYIDYSSGVEELVNSYLDKGIDDIVVIQDRKNITIQNSILEGTNKAFEKHNKKFNGFLKIDNSHINTYEFLMEYLEKHRHKVILASRDSIALAVLNACRDHNISIPNDTEIVCVMDSRYCSMVRPQLSTFVTPSYDVGALAMRVMTKMLNNEQLNEKNFKLDYMFKERSSTKK